MSWARARRAGRIGAATIATLVGIAAVTLTSACGESDGPCAHVAGRCLIVELDAAPSVRLTAIDQVELDLLYGGVHGTATTSRPGGGVTSLPLETSVELDVTSPGPLPIGVVAAGKLSGTVRGTGAASTSLEPGEHKRIQIHLAPPEACTAGTTYCGGDKVAGDPQTLYLCNGGGVPLARGVCVFGCIVVPAQSDRCRGGGGACIEGTKYCGGDKLDGDPRTLYTCVGGVAENPQPCANECVVAPEGVADYCR
ncbi:MAG: hypothetical protein R3B48_16190 [Kofleriaceae bacterium]